MDIVVHQFPSFILYRYLLTNCSSVAFFPGFMDSDRNGKIVGGQDAESIIPWQVSIGNDHYGHFCGGTILDGWTILTAAHCFTKCQSNWDHFYVMPGTADKTDGDGGTKVSFFNLKKLELKFVCNIAYHSQWNLELGHAL